MNFLDFRVLLFPCLLICYSGIMLLLLAFLLLVGLFGYDNFSAVIRNLKDRGIPGSAGPFGIIGFGGSAGVAMNLAYYRGPSANGFWGYQDEEIIRDWLGLFSNINGQIADWGVSGFASDYYIGISGSLPWASIGGGYSASNTDFYRITDARKHLGEITSFLAEQLSRYRTNNPKAESAKVRFIAKCEDLLTDFSNRINR